MTLRGAVTERPRKRGRISTGVYFRHDLSIKVPHAARYRVDGGAWQPLAATDGAFGEPSEGWTLTTEPLTAGPPRARPRGDDRRDGRPDQRPVGRPHAGHARVRCQRGVHQDRGDRRGRLNGAPVRAQHGTDTGTGTVWPVPRLAPVRLVRLADAKRPIARVTTGENGVWTGTIKPARSGVYEVRFAGAGQFLAADDLPARDHHRQVVSSPRRALHSPDTRAERT